MFTFRAPGATITESRPEAFATIRRLGRRLILRQRRDDFIPDGVNLCRCQSRITEQAHQLLPSGIEPLGDRRVLAGRGDFVHQLQKPKAHPQQQVRRGSTSVPAFASTRSMSPTVLTGSPLLRIARSGAGGAGARAVNESSESADV